MKKKMFDLKLLIVLVMMSLFYGSCLAQGPIMIVGIDTEYGERPLNNSHGSIATWCNIFNTGLLANVTNGQSDILVVGGIIDATNNVRNFWGQVSACLGRSVTHITVSDILSIDFNDFAMVAVATDHESVTGHLTLEELQAMNTRRDAIAQFICSGGALFASSCEYDNPYSYISTFGNITISSTNYTDVTATPNGLAVGINNTNLDNGPWHITFNTFPAFLQVLAVNPNNRVAALGGRNLLLADPKFTLPSPEQCRSDDIIADPSLTFGAIDHFWSIQESDADWNRFGAELWEWFAGPPTIRNLSAWARSRGFSFKCNAYYRIKFALSDFCGEWHETTQLIKITCPIANAGPDLCCIDLPAEFKIGIPFPDPELSYTWAPSSPLNNPHLSNPTVALGDILGATPFSFIQTVTDSAGCTNSDTMEIFCGVPKINLHLERYGCCAFKLALGGEEIGDIVWSSGETNVSSIDIVSPGTYAVTVTNPCGSAVQQIIISSTDLVSGDVADIIFPNAFTPNGDGMNDYFQLIHFGTTAPAIDSIPAYNATEYRLSIFDRWGGQHIVSTGYSCTGFFNGEIQWDGKINGTLVPNGVYTFILELKNCTHREWTIPKLYHAKFVCDHCGFGLLLFDCGFFRTCEYGHFENVLLNYTWGSVMVIR